MNPTLGFVLLSILSVSVVLIIQGTWLFQYYLASVASPTPPTGTKFDFIVVGSGTSGSVLAARLAEAGENVLLLEAGGPSHFLQGIPAFTDFFRGSSYDWGFKTTQNKHAHKALNNFQQPYPRGKGLGGSSMLNYMLHTRGHSKDYDEWEYMGAKGWSFKDVLPYFKKSEDFVGTDRPDQGKYYGKGGPTTISDASYQHGAQPILRQAFEEVGYPFGDPNGMDENEGFFDKLQLTLKNGWRYGTFRNYVEPVQAKGGDITVLTFALANKVFLRDYNKFAKGIRFERFGANYTYNARKEVILSAGAIGTPQLLMLSGIGPRIHLIENGIQVKRDLPVGMNLQDHLQVSLPFFTEKDLDLSPCSLSFLNPLSYLKLLSGEGDLSVPSDVVNGLAHTPKNEDKVRPDLQIHTSAYSTGWDYGARLGKIFGFTDEVFEQSFGKYLGKETVTVSPTLIYPVSRGRVLLSGPRMADRPGVHTNFLSEGHDVRTLVEGMSFMHSLKDTKAFKDAGLVPFAANSHDCAQFEEGSNGYMTCLVRLYSRGTGDAAGTCRMGTDKDPEAVVTPELKVKGFDNLRVVDASVMPRLVGAGAQATCIMIGEKAADMILEEWKTKVVQEGEPEATKGSRATKERPKSDEL